MMLRWPNEDVGLLSRHTSEMDRFLANYRTLTQRLEAGRRLHGIAVNSGDPEAEATALEPDHPVLAARVRLEADDPWLLTSSALRAEAALADAAELPPVESVRRLGMASDDPVGARVIADALGDAALRRHVVEGLRAAFAEPPVFLGDGMNGEPSRAVEEAQQAIRQSRANWAEPEKRSLRELRMTLQWGSHVTSVEPAHYLMAPLSRAAPEAAIDFLDAMPSPLDAVLCLELVHLDVERFEAWARAIRCAPSAWSNEGWIGMHGAPRGLALPLLLWRAEEHLRRMPVDAEPGRVTPEDVARAVRNRDDGARAAWRWCADLLEQADRRERDGQSGPGDGIYRAAQALATGGGWLDFDPGRGRDALHLEAACRLVPDAQDSSPHLASLLPSEPENFLDGKAGADLSWAAFSLVGALGPMFEGRPPYGLVTRILSTSFWGKDGPQRLSALWTSALVLREMAAGGVTKGGDSDAADRHDPIVPLHLIVAMGIAAVEMREHGGGGDIAGLLLEVDAMLAELRPCDTLGYDVLAAKRQAISTRE